MTGINMLTPELIYVNARAKVSSSVNQSIPSGTTTVIYDVVDYIEDLEYDTATGIFTTKAAMDLIVSPYHRLNAAVDTIQYSVVDESDSVIQNIGVIGSTVQRFSASNSVRLDKGQKFKIALFNGGGSTNLAGGAQHNFVTMHRASNYSHRRPTGYALAGPDRAGLLESYIKEKIAAGGQFTGDADFMLTKSGKTVTLTALQIWSHSSSNSRASAAGVVPEWARPAVITGNAYTIGSNYLANVFVNDAGTITVDYRTYTGATFDRTNTGVAITLSWNVED